MDFLDFSVFKKVFGKLQEMFYFKGVGAYCVTGLEKLV